MKLFGTFNMVLAAALVSISVQGAEIDYAKAKKKLQARKPGLTSRVTHKRLEKAFSYVRREKYTHAIEVLVELLKQTRTRKDEFAQIWQQLGFVLAQKGDYAKAQKALGNALKLDVLPYAQTMTTLFTIAQIQVTTEKYQDAEKSMRDWFGYAEQPSAEAYILMGTILSQLDKKPEALKYVNQAIVSTEKPQEKWLQFALALNYELKHYDNALKILAILTAQYPENEKYWKQLSSTYLSLNDDQKALATMELGYKLGHIKSEADLTNMASLYIFLDMPAKGAAMLEKEIANKRVAVTAKSMDLLSQAWMQAKERSKSMVALQKAADMSNVGDLYARKGFIHLENEEWDAAINSLGQGAKKGVKAPEKVYFAMGIAKYNKQDLSGAMQSLLTARKFKADDKNVNQWIEQIKNDQMRQATQLASSATGTSTEM